MEMISQKIKSLIYAGIGLVLCVLLCGGMSMTAQAEERTDDGFYYEENKDGGITITGYTGDETELVIPREIDGKGHAISPNASRTFTMSAHWPTAKERMEERKVRKTVKRHLNIVHQAIA